MSPSSATLYAPSTSSLQPSQYGGFVPSATEGFQTAAAMRHPVGRATNQMGPSLFRRAMSGSGRKTADTQSLGATSASVGRSINSISSAALGGFSSSSFSTTSQTSRSVVAPIPTVRVVSSSSRGRLPSVIQPTSTTSAASTSRNGKGSTTQDRADTLETNLDPLNEPLRGANHPKKRLGMRGPLKPFGAPKEKRARTE